MSLMFLRDESVFRVLGLYYHLGLVLAENFESWRILLGELSHVDREKKFLLHVLGINSDDFLKK